MDEVTAEVLAADLREAIERGTVEVEATQGQRAATLVAERLVEALGQLKNTSGAGAG